LKFVWQKEAGKTANNNEVFDHVTTVTKGSMYLLLPYANDTHTRNRYQKLVPENWYQFSGTSFSYQMKLEAKLLD